MAMAKINDEVEVMAKARKMTMAEAKEMAMAMAMVKVKTVIRQWRRESETQKQKFRKTVAAWQARKSSVSRRHTERKRK